MVEIGYSPLEDKEKNDKYIEKFKRKPMTLVIGIKCVDGIILAGDRKVTRGTECFEEKKIISPFKDFLLGYSGEKVYMEKLKSIIKDYEFPENEIKNWGKFEKYLEDSVKYLLERYKSRIDCSMFDVLYTEKMSTENARLNYLSIQGYILPITTFFAIGHGVPSALPFLKAVYSSEINMDQAIELCVFILKLIDDCDIDTTVGGKPQVYKVPDVGDAKEVSEEEIDVLLNRTQVKKRLSAAIFKQCKMLSN